MHANSNDTELFSPDKQGKSFLEQPYTVHYCIHRVKHLCSANNRPVKHADCQRIQALHEKENAGSSNLPVGAMHGHLRVLDA